MQDSFEIFKILYAKGQHKQNLWSKGKLSIQLHYIFVSKIYIKYLHKIQIKKSKQKKKQPDCSQKRKGIDQQIYTKCLILLVVKEIQLREVFF